MMSKKKRTKIDDLSQNSHELQENVPIYSVAKQELKQMVQRTEQENISDSKPVTAIEVIDEDMDQKQPIKQAFIAEHLFRKTIEDAIPCGIAAADNFGRQIYVNRTFCHMLGWGRDELMGATSPYAYWDPLDFERLRDKYMQVIKGRIPSEGLELPFLRKSGEKICGWVLGSTLYESDGVEAGYLIALVDISSKKRADEDLKRLSAQLVDAQERQRQLISQELHDSIGGRLAGLKYGMEKLLTSGPVNGKNMAGALEDLLDVVQSSIIEIQRITKNLHPSVLDDLGLKAAVRDLVREFVILYPNIQTACSLDIEENLISEHLKILIYRVCQEALTNIGKHSRADHASLRLHHVKGKVVLTVEDNGMGIPSELKEGGPDDSWRLGLLNMRERTVLAGGCLEVLSRKGRGVSIQAIWPNRPPAASLDETS